MRLGFRVSCLLVVVLKVSQLSWYNCGEYSCGFIRDYEVMVAGVVVFIPLYCQVKG